MPRPDPAHHQRAAPSPILRAPAHLPRLRQRQTSAPVSRPSTDRRTSPGASPSTFRRASSKATKAASNSGRHVPRPPGGSASPPPSTTSARPGASAGSPSASSRCAGRGSRASARRTWPGFDAADNKLSLLQADEALYLHPRRSPRTRGRRSTWMTTRGRTSCWRWTSPRTCEGASSESTRRGVFRRSGCSCPPESRLRAPGLDIHLLRDGRYREAPESGAFPGWRADEIYLALIEGPLSPRARPALERVARAMGAREGTRPEDDPITRSNQPAGGGAGQGGRPPGSTRGDRARGAPRSRYRGHPRPRRRPRPVRRVSRRRPDRRSHRVPGRDRLPPPPPQHRPIARSAPPRLLMDRPILGRVGPSHQGGRGPVRRR